ncbi:MAG: LysM domain-containing protein [Peptococcaceae bacterium]|nr:LysM domain-containing protein [Peptococcaceae bacterium]
MHYGHYIVRRGDTLHRIAACHGTSVGRLTRLNPQITRPDLIFPGERIRLR